MLIPWTFAGKEDNAWARILAGEGGEDKAGGKRPEERVKPVEDPLNTGDSALGNAESDLQSPDVAEEGALWSYDEGK